MIESTALSYFRAVVEAGSIQAAARNVVIAPSAVSRQIKLLEKEVGTELFGRSARGMSPTPAGRLLYDHALRQAAEANDVRRLLRLGLDDGPVDFKIASVEGALPALLPSYLRALRYKYPQVLFSVQSMASTAVVAAVSAGDADVGFAFGRVARAGLRELATLSIPIRLAVRNDHPLARRGEVSIQDVAEDWHVLPNTRFGIRREVDAHCARFGLELRIAYETDSLEFGLTMVKLEGLVTFTTSMMLTADSRLPITMLKLSEDAFNSTSISLVSRAGSSSSLMAALQHDLAATMTRTNAMS